MGITSMMETKKKPAQTSIPSNRFSPQRSFALSQNVDNDLTSESQSNHNNAVKSGFSFRNIPLFTDERVDELRNLYPVRQSIFEERQNVPRISQEIVSAYQPQSLGPEKGIGIQMKQESEQTGDISEKEAEQTANSVPPIVNKVLESGGGHPLDSSTRAIFEPRFGHDFSQVRVHTDAQSAESAQAVNSLAYTAGRDVVFGAGQYAPGTSTGQRLLAHELTHVIQQKGANVDSNQLQLISPTTSAETEAKHIATVPNNRQTQVKQQATQGIMRETEEGEDTRQEQEDIPGFWGTMSGGLMGEFNE
ncbi:MAG: DUF4157 domain-containing protein, partial [Candidatus Poribacteria bacterium]